MQPLGLLVWLIVGGLAGGLAGRAMKSGGGVITDAVVGVIGAYAGGLFFNAIGQTASTGFNLWSIFGAFIGAVVLLVAIRIFNIRRRRHIFN
jgi:uncharacterized membrane protein YeaQ/YmgE (transglycosylase-associated protein family)